MYIARPPNAPPSQSRGPRVNEEIRVDSIRLIDHEGNQIGVVPIARGLEMADQVGLDLVEVAPEADPPVCKILDYGKYKFVAQKKKAEARKKQKVVEIKEIKMRPSIDTHDYEVKMRNIVKFLEDGDKVKITLRFRGRELAHQDIAYRLLERVRTEIDAISKIESSPRMEGRQMVMVVAPK